VPKERLEEAPFWHLEKCKPAKSEWSGGQDRASYLILKIQFHSDEGGIT